MRLPKFILARATLWALAGVLIAGQANAAAVTPDKVKISDGEIAMSLTGNAGDALSGRKLFKNRKLGNCLACHANQDMTKQPFHGEIGPTMDGIAKRFSVPQLRAILVNSKAVFGDGTIMPGFYRVNPGARTQKKFTDKTILSAQQIEDIIAYLTTLAE